MERMLAKAPIGGALNDVGVIHTIKYINFIIKENNPENTEML
jgi:hypothetical protein